MLLQLHHHDEHQYQHKVLVDDVFKIKKIIQ